MSPKRALLRLVPDRDRDTRAGLLARHALALGGSRRLPEARTALDAERRNALGAEFDAAKARAT